MILLQGLGCTYSFCGKYESCADCVTDPSCGWCDSSRSCLGGVAEGPPKIECPDWFYYYCYTVEDGECSRDIMVSGKEGERRKILIVYDFLNVFFNNYVMRVEWYFARTNQIAALGYVYGTNQIAA